MPALLRVSRDDPFSGRFRHMRITEDGRVLLEVPALGSASVEVDPGRHVLVARMDWVSSPPLELDVANGREYHLETALSPNLFRIAYKWQTANVLRLVKTV